MHLYKPNYADIPNPKITGQKNSETARAKKPNAASKNCLSPRCLAMTLYASREQKSLERFAYVHGLSLKETIKEETGMIYR